MDRVTELMLAELPPGSMIKARWTDGSQEEFTAVRIDADYAGAATNGWGLYGTKQWLEIADWTGVEIEIVHRHTASKS